MKASSENCPPLPEDNRQTFSFFTIKDSYRLEYEKVIAFCKNPPVFLQIADCLVEAIDSYDKYCKILSLDKDYLAKITDDPLTLIVGFTGILGAHGCILSLHRLYDDRHMNEQIFTTYRKAMLEPYAEFPDYGQWLMDTIRFCKASAAVGGHIKILKDFFPNIVSSQMLARIFMLVSACQELPQELYEDKETIEQQKFLRQLLADNMDEYKECVRYLLNKGVVFDMSDNCKHGAVTYLESSGSYLSILEFCLLFKDSVSDSERELLNLILDPELLPASSFRNLA